MAETFISGLARTLRLSDVREEQDKYMQMVIQAGMADKQLKQEQAFRREIIAKQEMDAEKGFYMQTLGSIIPEWDAAMNLKGKQKVAAIKRIKDKYDTMRKVAKPKYYSWENFDKLPMFQLEKETEKPKKKGLFDNLFPADAPINKFFIETPETQMRNKKFEETITDPSKLKKWLQGGK